MSIFLSLLSKYWPYLVVATLAGFATHKIDNARYDSLQASFSAYEAQVAQANGVAQEAARQALQAEIDKRLSTEQSNASIIVQYQQIQAQADSDHRDLLFANRLLAAAQAKSPATGHQVPAPGDQPGSAQPAGSSGDRPAANVAGLTAAAADDTRQCFERYAALLAELKGQL